MKLRLRKKISEVGEVVSFIFESEDLTTWLAGQYVNLTMPDVAPVYADRLFTIASAPHESEIRITTYIGPSPFKQRLNQLRPGDIIEADQLGGDFIWQADGRQKLFIAGGIGATTFRSIMLDRLYHQQPIEAIMLYAGRDDRRPFVEAFRDIAARDKTLQIRDYVDIRLTLARLLQDIPDVFERTVYLSGSQAFSEMLGEGLIKAGITRAQIKYDYFDGYIDIEY